MILKRITALGLLAMAVALTGCGNDAPSSSEAKAAMQAEMDKEMAAFVKIAGAKAGDAMRASLPDLKSVELISCEKVQEKTSRCEVKMELSMMGQTQSDTMTISFAKGPDAFHSRARYACRSRFPAAFYLALGHCALRMQSHICRQDSDGPPAVASDAASLQASSPLVRAHIHTNH